jgi:YegS/Rv2252/BmrU family lipid kinase
VAETSGPGQAARLVEQARDAGVDCIAVVGGDGSVNEVAQAYVDAEGAPVPGPELGLIPAGTGGDFRKTFGIGDSIEEAVMRLVKSPPRPIDLGVARLTSEAGQPIVRAFINILSFGIGGLTDHIVNRGPKWIGGRAAFFIGTLRAMVAYRNAAVRLSIDGKVELEQPVLNVAIANGQYFGGGMHIAPLADPSDGEFDIVALGDLSVVQSLTLAPRVYQGDHLSHPQIFHTRGKSVEAVPVRSGEQVLIDLDGETPGKLPLTAHVLPGAIKIRA